MRKFLIPAVLFAVALLAGSARCCDHVRAFTLPASAACYQQPAQLFFFQQQAPAPRVFFFRSAPARRQTVFFQQQPARSRLDVTIRRGLFGRRRIRIRSR